MNKITHQPADETLDEFCRDVINAARASDQEVNAALNAPFLYPRLRARIEDERAARTSVFVEAGKRWDWARQWRWALTGVALALLTLAGWRWLQAPPAAPLVAYEQPAPSVIVTEASVPPVPPAKNKVVAKPLLATSTKARRAVPLPEDSEIATDYLPLTYVADSEEQSGQVVRVEMPRSAMLALGFPVDNEFTSELVKADVIVGDDGLALAIRFVRTLDKSSIP